MRGLARWRFGEAANRPAWCGQGVATVWLEVSMQRPRALGPRPVSFRLAPAGATLLPAILLASCGPSAPAPTADRFNPARPTTKGSMADAVRDAQSRTAGRSVRQLATTPTEPVPPEQLFDPEPAPDAAATREHVLGYLTAMDALLTELDGVASGRRGESLASVAAKADDVQASLNRLVSAPPETRRAVHAELGSRIADVRARLNARVESFSRDESRQPIVNLVANLPLLE